MSRVQQVEAWIGLSGKPVFDYTRAFWLVMMSLLGLGITVMMAYGFSFRASIDVPYHIGLTIGFIIISVCLQTLRENGLEKRTENAEAKAERQRSEYVSKQSEMRQEQRELNALANELNKSQEELSHLLKTMPPPHALSSFTESFNYVLLLWRSRGQSPRTVKEAEKRIELYEEWIRICLNAIARLFLQYEHKPMTTKCTAHFAQFFSVEEFESDKELKARVLEGLRFVDNPRTPLVGLEGVMCINPAFSAFSEPKNKNSRNPDPNLTKEFFLPVPIDDDEIGGPSRFLPIAPQAFKHGLVNIPDVSSGITEDASTNWNVTRKVVTQVLDYFKNGEHGRMGSVVGYRLIWDDSNPELPVAPETHAVPVASNTQDSSGSKIKGIKLGVLTLFTETPNSKENEVLSSFFDLVRPIVEMTKTLLVSNMKIRAKLRANEYEQDGPGGD